MKTHFCLFSMITLVIFLGCSASKSRQEKILEYFSQTGARLKTVHFTSSSIGFVVGEKGTILKTTTGGSKWNSLVSETSQDLYSVYFLDANLGYIVGGNPQPIILKTTNGGINCIQKQFNSGMFLASVYFLNPKDGFAVGPMIVLHTNDDGETWMKQSDTSFLSNHLNSIFFTDSNNGFIVGAALGGPDDKGIIYKTINGGKDWSCIYRTSGYMLTSVHFASSKIGFTVGWNSKTLNGAIFKTTNGGNDWHQFNFGSNKVPSLFSVFFTSADTGFIAGQTILKTRVGNQINNRIFFVQRLQVHRLYSTSIFLSDYIKMA